MKITLRIPTKDPYAFVELEDELESVTPEDAVTIYENFTKAFKGEPEGFGIPPKDFNRIFDHYRLQGSIPAEDVPLCEDMDKGQKDCISALKRSLTRNK